MIHTHLHAEAVCWRSCCIYGGTVYMLCLYRHVCMYELCMCAISGHCMCACFSRSVCSVFSVCKEMVVVLCLNVKPGDQAVSCSCLNLVCFSLSEFPFASDFFCFEVENFSDQKSVLQFGSMFFFPSRFSCTKVRIQRGWATGHPFWQRFS